MEKVKEKEKAERAFKDIVTTVEGSAILPGSARKERVEKDGKGREAEKTEKERERTTGRLPHGSADGRMMDGKVAAGRRAPT